MTICTHCDNTGIELHETSEYPPEPCSVCKGKKQEQGFTPGPWTLSNDETPWTLGDSQTAVEQGEPFGHTEILFSLKAGEQGDDWPIAYLVWEPLADDRRAAELRANARLIAAAPELLSALTGLVSNLRTGTTVRTVQQQAQDLLDAEAVIKKARGI